MGDVYRWSQTPISNGTADPTINWQEGQLANTINDSARGMMAAFAAWRDDNSGQITTGGTANAYTATIPSSIDVYRTGLVVTLKLDRANTGAATLSINGLTGLAWTKTDGTAFVANDLKANAVVRVAYNPAVPRFELLIGSFHQHDISEILNAPTNSTVAAQFPAGSVTAFAGATPPAGYLLCNGAAVSRTTYAALFTAISTVWGVGDGSTTFNLPDFRGRALVGVDAALTNLSAPFNALGGVGGEKAHTLTVPELPNFTNQATLSGYFGAVSAGPLPLALIGGGTINNTSVGSNVPHNVVQPSAAINWIIRT